MAQNVNDVPSSVTVNYPQKPVYLPIELVQHKVARRFTLLRSTDTPLPSTSLSPGFHERIMVTTNMTMKIAISERGLGQLAVLHLCTARQKRSMMTFQSNESYSFDLKWLLLSILCERCMIRCVCMYAPFWSARASVYTFPSGAYRAFRQVRKLQ